MNSISKIHETKYKYIFFDIFDTLLYRKVQPEFTKKIWANHLTSSLDLNINMIELYSLRNKLEQELGERNYNTGKDWEFKYIDLIKEIYKRIDTNITEKEFITLSTTLEVGIESSVLIPHEDIIKEIKIAKKKNKKIYCVSDMYLSKEMLSSIFENLGIKNLFDDIYVSCEYLVNKKSGKLYEKVIKDIKAKNSECIMIGDNKSSDYEIPKKIGIDAIHIDRTKQYKKYDEFLKEHNETIVYNKFRELQTGNTDNFENSIFSLYRFISRLYFNLIKNNLDEVFFLSREGEFLKKLFDKFVETVDNKKIKSHYILVSRKATYLPSLKSINKEDFSVLLQQYVYISINEFFKSLNFEKNELEAIKKSLMIDFEKTSTKGFNSREKEEIKELIAGNFDKKIIYLYSSKILQIIKKNKTFADIYEKNRIEQSALFKKYIKQFTNEKRICVVDIGWNGSIQDNIQNILGDKYEVTGYLYGLVSRNPEKCKNKEGLVFTNVPEVSNNFELYCENRTIYEILLGASHGSANRYVEKNGHVEVLTFEKEEERKIYTNVISKIQNDMLDIFKELVNILANEYYNDKYIKKEINRIHYKMLYKPTKKQLTFFNRIYHYENFGVFEFTDFRLHNKLTPYFYLKENAKYFLKRKHFFDTSFWPVLKLYNEKLFIPRFIYVNHKMLKYKRKGLI